MTHPESSTGPFPQPPGQPGTPEAMPPSPQAPVVSPDQTHFPKVPSPRVAPISYLPTRFPMAAHVPPPPSFGCGSGRVAAVSCAPPVWVSEHRIVSMEEDSRRPDSAGSTRSINRWIDRSKWLDDTSSLSGGRTTARRAAGPEHVQRLRTFPRTPPKVIPSVQP